MTRINVGVEPSELTDRHLLAEHREIKRIPNMVKAGRVRMDGIPDTFTLGKGHVKFFYDKLAFLRNRYSRIYAECVSRGFNVTNFSDAFSNIDTRYMGDYAPTEHDRSIITARISQRLAESKGSNRGYTVRVASTD